MIMPVKKPGTHAIWLSSTLRRCKSRQGSRGARFEMRFPGMSSERSASSLPTGVMSCTLCPAEMTRVSRNGKRDRLSRTLVAEEREEKEEEKEEKEEGG